MRQHLVKNLFFLILFTFVGLYSSGYAEEQTVLVCHPKDSHSESIGYEVHRDNSHYFILQTQNNVVLQRHPFGPSDFTQIIDGYGGTYLYLINKGRSGYLLIYHHQSFEPNEPDKPTTLIDINLFQPGDRGLNTQGPQTDFICLK